MAVVMGAFPAHSADYKVDKNASSIRFSGQHAGKDFSGTFEKWEARIQFDADALDTSRVEVTIDTASAVTGDKMYDGTLPAQDWFDVIDYPKAQFLSKSITLQEDGSYRMQGNLTIKNHTQSVAFSFRLEETQPSNVRTQFSVPLKRLDFAIGQESDGEAEWVSSEIKVEVVLNAQKN
jgi:cytochrome b561